MNASPALCQPTTPSSNTYGHWDGNDTSTAISNEGATSLLLVACSERKRQTPGLLPAIERYDGPVFRLIRRFLRHQKATPIIAILSAEFGLIPSTYAIPYYNRRMTVERAEILRPGVDRALGQIMQIRPVSEVFVSMGRVYQQALPVFAAATLAQLHLHVATGTMGYHLAALHDWLYGRPPEFHAREHSADARQGVQMHGISISLTGAQAMAIAHKALATGLGNPCAFQAWYVRVDDQRVAPKWLVSQLTGLPVGSFTTDEARRVLARLGIEVQRV
ncbi:MAG: DUF6884 domain-containing protein [Thermomicrobiales bacterium]